MERVATLHRHLCNNDDLKAGDRVVLDKNRGLAVIKKVHTDDPDGGKYYTVQILDDPGREIQTTSKHIIAKVDGVLGEEFKNLLK